MPDDKEKIPDGFSLLRRIHPNHMVPDRRNPPRRRLSSGAFRDQEMSVDVEEMLVAMGKDHTATKGPVGFGLVRFTAGLARTLAQEVAHEPVVGNDAHAVVRGHKSGATANAFRDGAAWVDKPDDVD